MRNGAAQDQYDGLGDELVGEDGDVHELQLDDVETWEDETSGGDPAPSTSTSTPAAKTSTRKGAKR